MDLFPIFLKDIADQIQGNTKGGNKSIHTSDEPMIIWRLKQEADMILDIYGGVAVFLRPGVHRFLYKLSEMCEVVLWTAGQKEYAQEVLNVLDPDGELIPVRNRLYRGHTVQGYDKERLKDLRLLGRDMRRTMLIDNSLVAIQAAPDNTLLIEDFYGDPCDEQLESIFDFVAALDDLSDIRTALKMSLKASGVLQEKASHLKKSYSKSRR
jgi:CTD small phosphatase-like protein 2